MKKKESDLVSYSKGLESLVKMMSYILTTVVSDEFGIAKNNIVHVKILIHPTTSYPHE